MDNAKRERIEELESIRNEGRRAGRRGNHGLPDVYFGANNRERAQAWHAGFDDFYYEVQKETQDAEADDAQYELFKKNMQRFVDERKSK